MVGDLTHRQRSQDNIATHGHSAPSSGSGASGSGAEGGPRRGSRLWAGGSRIDDFFAAAMTKVTNLVRRGVNKGTNKSNIGKSYPFFSNASR